MQDSFFAQVQKRKLNTTGIVATVTGILTATIVPIVLPTATIRIIHGTIIHTQEVIIALRIILLIAAIRPIVIQPTILVTAIPAIAMATTTAGERRAPANTMADAPKRLA